MVCDFQQFDILAGVGSDGPVRPSFGLGDSQLCSVSGLAVMEFQATSKGSDQTAHMCRLIWGFAGRTYHIVGNLMHWLIFYGSWVY